MSRRKRETNPYQSAAHSVAFSFPYVYFKTIFGVHSENSSIYSYVINPTVQQLRDDFLSFQELPKVEQWPVSKIIQREIDTERVEKIEIGYLNKDDGSLKYFPPLTCVLLPVSNEGFPADSFESPVEKFETIVRESVINVRSTEFKDYEDNPNIVGLFKGAYCIEFDGSSGSIVWDKDSVKAVIIDGQHRRQALIKSGKFGEWRQPIHVVDLRKISEIGNSKPTEVIRDLFLDVNKTPDLVDEARMILMNDRDLSCKIAQAIVDDSKPNVPIPPELVDWHCVKGKIGDAFLTGIIPIHQIIVFSVLNDCSLDSFDDKKNKFKIGKFCKRLATLLNINELFNRESDLAGNYSNYDMLFESWKAENDQSEAIEDTGPDNDLGYSGPSVFSPHEKITDFTLTIFCDYYLNVFSSVFGNLAPFHALVEKATSQGAFLKDDNIVRKYLRSSLAEKKRIEKTSEPEGKKVKKYTSEIMKIKGSGDTLLIPLTVMGQKTIFRCIFETIGAEINFDQPQQSIIDTINEETNFFIDIFNHLYENTTKSEPDSEGKDFFRLGFKISAPPKLKSKAGDLATSFWKGIIRKQNNEIDYSNNSCLLLRSIINEIVNFLGIDDESEEEKKFTFSESVQKKMLSKHCSILKKQSDLNDDKIEELSVELVKHKEASLAELLKKIPYED